MFFSNFHAVIAKQILSPLTSRSTIHCRSVIALLAFLMSLTIITACVRLPSSELPESEKNPVATMTPVPSKTPTHNVVATFWTAELIGKLNIIDGCVRAIDRVDNVSRLLVWPPDFEVTIEKDTVRVIGGKVSGNHTEVLLHDGEWVRLSGGETSQPNEQLLSSEPPNCPGPYWVVGFEVGPYPALKETCAYLNTTPTIINSPTAIPTNTTLPKQNAILFSYTYFSDGGDDLLICLTGSGHPTYILYNDGFYIFFKDGQYWQSELSLDEISALMEKISEIGLNEQPASEYSEGNNVLELNGQEYRGRSDIRDLDPLSQTLKIIYQYQPKNFKQFIPKILLLGIYEIHEMEYIQDLIPQSTPIVTDWDNDPISSYGSGWRTIRGAEVPAVISQFNSFPGVKIIKKGDSYFVASICAQSIEE